MSNSRPRRKVVEIEEEEVHDPFLDEDEEVEEVKSTARPRTKNRPKEAPRRENRANKNGHVDMAWNNVRLWGMIVKDDPEIVVTPNSYVCHFRLMTSMGKLPSGQYRDSLFMDIESWGDVATKIYDDFRQGDKVVVHGRLSPSIWKDRNGATHNDVKIITDLVQLREEQDDA